jgi:hypothetical protein
MGMVFNTHCLGCTRKMMKGKIWSVSSEFRSVGLYTNLTGILEVPHILPELHDSLQYVEVDAILVCQQ